MPSPTPSLQTHRLAARLLLACAAATLYLATLSPGPGWLDQSELIAGAWTLGVVHPPGHPLYALLAKAATLIPLGGIGFRVNLLSAALGVLCALLTSSLVERIAGATGRGGRGAVWCGAAAGLVLATTGACWLQSVRAEVYTLNAAITLGGVWLAVRWIETRRARDLLAFCVLIGLGLANHHYLVFFLLPAPLMVLLLAPEGRRWLTSGRVAWGLALILVALAAYAYLPIRAAADPVINWNDPRTIARFVDTLTARTFQSSVSADTREAGLAENLAVAMGMLIEQLGPAVFLAGLLGLGLLVRMHRPLGLLVLGAFALNLLTKGIMFIDPDNPDDYGYFLLGVALLAVAAGLVPLLLPLATERLASGVAAAGAALLTVSAAWQVHAAPVDLSGDASAEAVADATLDRVEPRSVLLVRYYALFFNHWYAQLIDGKRPDVVVVQETFDAPRYGGRPYVESLMRRHPDLASVGQAFLASGDLPYGALRALAVDRPVYVQPTLDRRWAPGELGPVGLVRRVVHPAPLDDETARAEDAALWSAVLRDAWRDGPPGAEARKAMDWLHFQQTMLTLRQGLPRTAEQIVARWAGVGQAGPPDLLAPLARTLDAAIRGAAASPPSAQPFRRLQADIRRAFLTRLSPAGLLAD